MYDACVCISYQTTHSEKWRWPTACLITLAVFATAQQTGEGFVIMWQHSVQDHDPPIHGGPRGTKTTLYYHMRPAPRERSLDEMHFVCVSHVNLSHLWTESFDPSHWIIVLFWSAGESSAGDVPVPPVVVDGHLPTPPLPSPSQSLVIVSPQKPLIPGQPRSDH